MSPLGSEIVSLNSTANFKTEFFCMLHLQFVGNINVLNAFSYSNKKTNSSAAAQAASK